MKVKVLCPACQRPRTVDSHDWSKRKSDLCKKCHDTARSKNKQPKNNGYDPARYKKWVRDNQEKVKENHKRYYEKHKAKLLEQQKNRVIRHKYGLDNAAVQSLLAAQHGMCAICCEALARKKQTIDHCHSTGMVRALLCTQCNSGLGMFKEDKLRLSRAIDYLTRFEWLR